MKILITGGAGFVGSNLGMRFKEDNPAYEVVVLDNLLRKGSRLNLPRLKKSGIKFIHGDIRDKADLKKAGGFDLMLECSAEPSVLAGFNSPAEDLISTNLFGTVNCLEAVRRHKAGIIFLSTSRVYPIEPIKKLKYKKLASRFELASGQKTPGVSIKGISEDFPLGGQRSLYGATKLASELILGEYAQMYKMRGIINRCGVITGPWQMGKVEQGVVALWVARHIYGGRLSYIGYGGKGRQVRDILHVDDLYRLIRLQIKDMAGHNAQAYNVGGGKRVSISLCELTGLCRKVTGRSIRIGSVSSVRSADIPYYISDCSKAEKAFGWYPKKGPEDIVTDIALWINRNKRILKTVLS